MDKIWSEKCKEIKALIPKKATFREGVDKLIAFRGEMFGQLTQIFDSFPKEAFSLMPFAGADGYHSKTLAYSVWHIFRIEDIVAHEMIAEDKQIFFSEDFCESIGSPIITTGNELSDHEIAEFSEKLDLKELYRYASEVRTSTDRMILGLEHSDLKRSFGEDMCSRLQNTRCVSEDEKAVWLIGYWCGKNIAGLIGMPFSRHWIMHIEAMRRIGDKLGKQVR